MFSKTDADDNASQHFVFMTTLLTRQNRVRISLVDRDG